METAYSFKNWKAFCQGSWCGLRCRVRDCARREETRRAKIWKDPRSLPSTKMTNVRHCLKSSYHRQYFPVSLIPSRNEDSYSDSFLSPIRIITRANPVAKIVLSDKTLAIRFCLVSNLIACRLIRLAMNRGEHWLNANSKE